MYQVIDMPKPETVAAPSKPEILTVRTGQANLNRNLAPARRVPDAESPAPTESTEAKAEKTFSPREQAFARREKEIRAQYQKFQEEKKTWEAEKLSRETSFIPKDKLTELLATNPQSLGIDYEKLTELLLNQPKPEDIQLEKLRERLKTIEETQTKTLTQFEEQQKRDREQALNTLKHDASQYLLREEFAVLKEIQEKTGLDVAEAAKLYIAEEFDKSGTMLDVDQALRDIETHWLEAASPITQISKIREKFLPEQGAPTSEVKSIASAPLKTASPVARTLTNSQNASSPSRLTEKERRTRAIAAFRGELT